ncbi:MAG: hypothetical protein CMD58_00150 [Gammaproteobacteria bacterium]|nr:hypothetical protein [Gammaproteobacteria bacterium]
MEYLKSLLNSLSAQTTLPEFTGILFALLVSCICSILLFILYEYFYKYKQTGSQIHRSFFIIGPSVTGIFIAIQFSLPLSLGLLGALSFIRFRTPIKDPEEVGFMFALVAVAICSATFNFALVIILLLAIFILLLLKNYYIDNKFSSYGFGYFFLSVNPNIFDHDAFLLELNKILPQAQLITANKNNSDCHYQYTFNDMQVLNRGELINKFKDFPGVLNLDISFSNRSNSFII